MKQSSRPPTLALLFLLTLSTPELRSADWPQWRGPESDGISRETEWRPEALKSPRVLWRAEVGKGFSSIAVVGDRAYTVGNNRGQDTVFCLESSSGRVVWRYDYACPLGQYPGPRATPTIDGDRLYTLSQEGHLLCLDRSSGKLAWKRDLGRDFGIRSPTWGHAGSPRVVGELVLLNAGTAGLALRKRDGIKVWQNGQGPGGYATPVILEREGVTYAAIFGSRSLSVVEVSTGAAGWTYPWVTSSNVNAADPVLVGERLLISSNYGNGAALIELGSGGARAVWESDNLHSHFSSAVYRDGRIYGISGDARLPQGRLVCLDAATGRAVWHTPAGIGSVMIAGDTLIVSGSVGSASSIVTASLGSDVYHELSRASVMRGLSWTPPTLANARLYCRNVDGQVVCLDLT